MADLNVTASADPKAVSRKKTPELIKGVTLTQINSNGIYRPCAMYDGKAPEKGELIHFTLKNNVTYAGTVADATEADGNVLVEFKDGLKAVPQK